MPNMFLHILRKTQDIINVTKNKVQSAQNFIYIVQPASLRVFHAHSKAFAVVGTLQNKSTGIPMLGTGSKSSAVPVLCTFLRSYESIYKTCITSIVF